MRGFRAFLVLARPFLAAAAASLVFPAAARAQAVRLSDDFHAISAWLARETVQGLAFNTGTAYDPPSELRPWRMQPDISLGLGVVPLDKGRFPVLQSPTLAALDPQSMYPDQVTFPNVAMHLRMGLPGRMDLSFRGANMTVPKGHRLEGDTKGDGQSNSLGFTLRKHFFGGDADNTLVSLGLNYNHVFGVFNYNNEFKGIEFNQSPRIVADSKNTGRLGWDVTSLGANAVVSQNLGSWTPFLGVGYNRMRGSVTSRLESQFSTPIVNGGRPITGEASDKPEEHMGRVLFGVQLGGRSWFNVFFNAEVKALGDAAGKTFLVSTGLVAPFRMGAQSFVRREGSNETRVAKDRRPRSSPAPDSGRVRGGEAFYRRAVYGAPSRRRPASDESNLPEMTLIR